VAWEIRTAPARATRAPAPFRKTLSKPIRSEAETASAPPPTTWPLVPLTAGVLGLAPPRFVLANPATPPAPPPAASGTATTSATMAGGSTPRTAGTTAAALDADLARSATGMTGAGIKIGVLSDSFNLLGGMGADIARGDLPAGVQILEEGPPGSHDEGRAMADIIHSIAPGAQILFHTATAGEADFAAGIAALQAAGCQIIVDDVAYLDEPFFQDGGLVQAALENAIAAGVSYFTAASNEGEDFVQEAFRPMHVALPGLPPGALAQNFGAASAPQPWLDVTVPVGGTCLLDMQWDQPFAGIGAGSGSTNSLGLALYDASGHLVASATASAVGGDPVQVLQFLNTTQQTRFRLVVYANGGNTPPGQFKIIEYGNATLVAPATGPAIGNGSGTVIGHEMVPGANTVGAIAWSATPRYGGSGQIEPFSSTGTGSFLFDAQGHRLPVPQSAEKVDFVAPDGTATSVFAPFYGTSAAAPAAAAVAALMLQADPWLTPAQVTQLLEQSAVPVSGPANATGAGLIQADAAVQLALAFAHHRSG
jgi:subtilisin family serine protease